MATQCRLCCDPNWSEKAQKWALEGVSDREVARRLGINKSLVTRHRTNHIQKPAQHRLAIINKGADERKERKQLAAAAASNAPSTQAIVAASLGLQAQVKKLEVIEGRLERMAAQAEAGGSTTGVAVLSAQALRGVEVGSRLAGVGAYAPQRTPDQVAVGAQFSVQIVFAGANRTESFTTSARPTTIDSRDFSSSGEARGEDQEEDQDEREDERER